MVAVEAAEVVVIAEEMILEGKIDKLMLEAQMAAFEKELLFVIFGI